MQARGWDIALASREDGLLDVRFTQIVPAPLQVLSAE